MDRGTKIYAYVLLATVLAFVVWLLYEDPEVAALNAILSDDPEIAAYPYRFHVRRLEGSTAVIATPRSPQVPVHRVLRILYPEVSGRSPYSREFQRAWRELAEVERKAGLRVAAQPEVDAVLWELDEGWLHQRGVQVESLPVLTFGDSSESG